ncbi:MAG: mevalonate kinase [Chloroflexota bacterium]
MTRASAPGKIILFGEHAVVYEQPALAVPVTQVHADVEITNWDSSQKPLSNDPLASIWIDAPGIDLKKFLSDLPADNPIRFTFQNFVTFSQIELTSLMDQFNTNGITIHITSSIPVASGLGSGAAVSAALIRALSLHFLQPLTAAQINQLCYETEKIHHGNPSGIDNTVITFAEPVYFTRGKPIQTFRTGKPFTLVIANTGIPAPTKESVSDVRKLWQSDTVYWGKVFSEIGAIASNAKNIIEQGNWQLLGPLMNENHRLLQELTVSSPELDSMVNTALGSGAIGAKLSGGGRGGNIIALVDHHNQEKVASALEKLSNTAPIITTIQ